MAQPPAWLRHQAVEASSWAMVSITWKKVTGSVSIPSDERGSSRRNSCASCSLSSRTGGRRRLSSISFEAAATAGRTASARMITLRSPASSAEVGVIASKAVLVERCRYKSGGDGQFLVDLLDRFAPGLDSEEIIHRPGHQKPAAEIDERGRNLRQRDIGLEVVAGAHDQSEADRPDDLADAAEAIGRAHAGGPEVRGPDLRRIGPDDGKTPIGEEEGHGQQQPECRHPEQHRVVIIARDNGHDAGAEAKQAARVAPSHPLRKEREGEPADEAEDGEQDHHLG